MPVNDNNPKDPNAVTATTTPPSTLDADRRDLQRSRTGQSPYSIVNRGIEREVLPTCERYDRPIAGVESAGDGPAHRPLPQRPARGAERADEPGAPAADRRARCGMSR
ncbi:hypothetical protein [Streptosporangium sp. NPDC001681]|uniref:hypothetical protein n=1 Tax=Streptosporangium sp. NPDC001681 TaxID=3154395 RepID=UPI003332C381